jgi:hypothetical protein
MRVPCARGHTGHVDARGGRRRESVRGSGITMGEERAPGGGREQWDEEGGPPEEEGGSH